MRIFRASAAHPMHTGVSRVRCAQERSCNALVAARDSANGLATAAATMLRSGGYEDVVLRCHRCWGAHATCKMVRGARSAQRGFRSGRPAVRESTKRCSGRLPCRKPSDASTRRFRAAPRRATHMRRPGRCVTPAPRVRAPAACWTAAHDSTNLSCGRGGARLRVQRAVHRFCDAGDAAGHMRCAGACGERRVQVAACRAAWLVRTSLHTDPLRSAVPRRAVSTLK